MTEIAPGTRTSGRLWSTLLLLSIALGVLTLTFDSLLPGGLVRLAMIGLIAPVIGLIIFSYPIYGVLFGVFYVYANIYFFFEGFHPSYAVIGVALLGAMFGLLRGDSIELRDTAFNWAMALFTLLAVQSLLFAYSIDHAFQSFIQFVRSLLMVYLIVQVVRKPRHLETMAVVVFWGGVAMVILGVVGVVLGLVESVIAGEIGFLRFTGTQPNPNVAALYMVTAFPLGVIALLRYRSVLWRIGVLLGMVILIVATVFTFSRQAIFPLVFVLVAILVREAKNRTAYVAMFFVVLLVLLMTPQSYWQRIQSVWSVLTGQAQDYSFSLRSRALKTAWSLFIGHPFTGIGLNNFIVRAGGKLFVAIPVHNTYLEVLVGTGLFGLVAYLGVHLAAVRAAIRSRRAAWSDETKWMPSVAFYFLVSHLSALFFALFQSSPFDYALWIPAAAGLAATRMARRADRASQNPRN